MVKPSVLIDLSYAHKRSGFSGIPQDARLLFAGLALSPEISATGMLWSRSSVWHGERLDSIEAQSIFLGPHLDDPQLGLMARVARLANQRLGPAVERVFAGRGKKFGLHPLVTPALKDIIWRQLFASTIEPSQRKAVMDQNFVLTELGWWPVIDAPLLSRTAPKLSTPGQDYVIFQEARCVQVSASTKKIMRYHDGIPVLASDTMMSPSYIRRHIRALQSSAKDSYFVCNSSSARNDLSEICPQAADNATVIPYFVPKLQRTDLNAASLVDMATTRISTSTLVDKTPAEKVALQWFKLLNRPDVRISPENGTSKQIPKFILSLATIEPRKNYQGLIRAWQQLRHKREDDIKLVIIGKPGWNYEQILNEMKPHVAAGNLLHLEGVPQEELKFWYSSASCFAFPSFAEGFGLPPIEAMQCGCPVMVSDIPAHRYSAGDAALYCDPNDYEDIARVLGRLLDDDNHAEVTDLVQRGRKNAERFTHEAVTPLWEDLLTTGKLKQ